jgi:hypothetical protein
MPMPHRLPLSVALLAALAAGCSDKTPPETRLLVLDGIEVRLDEVEPYVRFLDESVPEGGRKTKVQRVLEEQILPLKLAQRAFPAERKLLRERAELLRSVSTNAYELEQNAAAIKDKRRAKFPRLHAKLPVAMFLFQLENLGSVSATIELPEGFSVVGSFDAKQHQLALEDSVDALEVAFFTHLGKEWREWLQAEQARVADKLTFVHPDYRFALPSWIHPPKQP